MLAVRGSLTVRDRSSTLGSTFFILIFSCFFSIPVSLLMVSLPLQTIVNTWQCFVYFLKPVLTVMQSTLMSGSSLEPSSEPFSNL